MPPPHWLRALPVLVFLLLLPSLSPAARPLILGAADSYRLGGVFVDVLEDPGGTLTIGDVTSPHVAAAFTPARQPVLNFGMTRSAFWLRFTIDGHDRNGTPWRLLLEHPLMDEVDLYVLRGDGTYAVTRSGDLRPMSTRALLGRDIVLPLPVDATPRTCYLRTWISGWAQVPLTVMTADAVNRKDSRDQFVFGGFSGLMIAMILVGLTLLGFTRELTYLFYVVYISCNLLIQMAFRGYLFAWMFPEHPLYHDYALMALSAVTIATGLFFTRTFLRVDRYAPRLDRCLKGLIVLVLLLIPCSVILPKLFFKSSISLLLMINTPLAIAAAVVSYRHGYGPARYFLFSRIIVYCGGFFYALVNFNVLPLNALTGNILIAVSVIDGALISLALADRFSLLNRQISDLVADLQRQVAERTAAHQSLEGEVTERLRLEREIVTISDNERRHISHELHDGLCQLLTGARLRYAALEERFTAAGLDSADVRPFGTLLDDAVNHAYDLSRGLWPLEPDSEREGLSLEEFLRRISLQSGIPIRFHQQERCERCGGELLTQLHRIAREAVANAAKHARASYISVSLVCRPREKVVLEVRDDGVGRNASRQSGGGMGISIMKHRADLIGGRLELHDGTGGGTRVCCTAPCPQRSQETEMSHA